MAIEGDLLRVKQFVRFIKKTNGNFKVHTKSGVFEGKNENVDEVATLLLNTHALIFGSYAINPNSIDVIEATDGAKPKDSKADTKGAGSRSSKGSSGASEEE